MCRLAIVRLVHPVAGLAIDGELRCRAPPGSARCPVRKEDKAGRSIWEWTTQISSRHTGSAKGVIVVGSCINGIKWISGN